MTLNFCLFKMKIWNCVARTPFFRWSIQWRMATQSLTAFSVTWCWSGIVVHWRFRAA